MQQPGRVAALITVSLLLASNLIACSVKAATQKPAATPAVQQPASDPLLGNTQMNPTAPANTARDAVGGANGAIGGQQQDVQNADK